MLKKTMTYKNYDGEDITEDFYFNLTKAELIDMELSTEGGLKTKLEKIVASRNVPEIIKMFKEIVLKAYGQKSADGKRFIKNAQLTEEFTQTEAYSELFMELATDDKAAAAFINAVLPQQQEANSNIPAPALK